MKSFATLVAAAVASALLAADSVQAKCSHDLQARGLEETKRMLAVVEREQAKGMSKRQGGPGSLAAQRQMLDPSQECTAYYYADMASKLSQYPAIWNIAQIVPGDSEATNAFNAIINDPAFPNLPPKGTPLGDFTSVKYDASDPDCWWTWGECTTPKHGGGAIPNDITTCPEPHTWGLTYDDGPNCTHNAFYNYLQEKQYTATMYFIGSNVINWPYQAQRALADGHEIAMHTWSHHYSTGLTNEQFFAELWYTRKAIKDVVGVTATAWRAPFGDVDDRIRFIATKMGLSLQLWDEDTDDWKVIGENNPGGLPTASVLNNYQNIYSHAQNGEYDTHGAIVLTHEINGHTMEIAIQELPSVAANFKYITSVATCLNISHPYIETDHTFPSFAQFISGQNKTLSNGQTFSSGSSSSTITGAASGTVAGSTATGSSGPVTKGISNNAGAAKAPGASTTPTGSATAGTEKPFLLSTIAALAILVALMQ